MTGWLILLLLIGAALILLQRMGARGGLLTAAAAALALGAAGYAVQGDPTLPAATAVVRGEGVTLPLTEARHAFFGNFAAGESWLRMSEAFARSGNTGDAVGILVNATRRYPNDPQLWIGLGNALVDQAGTLTPPARLAYQRANAIAPGNPASEFFYGLALARSGDRAQAVLIWRGLLAKASTEATWRTLVEQGINALDPAAQRLEPEPAPDQAAKGS